MAKSDSNKVTEVKKTGVLVGLEAFEGLGGTELDLGLKFFKPRIVPLHSICKGFLWTVREFPNFINPDTGKIMKAFIFKLTQDSYAAGDKDALVTVESGNELMVPVNYQIEVLEQFAHLQDTCHEVAIITLPEVPMKGKDSSGKDVPKSMRGFRYQVLRANVPRAIAEQEAVPAAIKALIASNNVAPSLSARS